MVKYFLNLLLRPFRSAKEFDKQSHILSTVVLSNKYNKKEWLPFYLNHCIKVRLTDEGYQLLADLHNHFLNIIPDWEYRTKHYYRLRADKEGYTTFQAWMFMQEFGPVTQMGGKQYYHLDVLIESHGN